MTIASSYKFGVNEILRKKHVDSRDMNKIYT